MSVNMELNRRARRRFLSSIAVCLPVLVSGCTFNEPSSESGEVNNETRELRLSELYVSNSHSEPHTVELELEYDGETVLNETFHLEAATENETKSKRVDKEWPDTPGTFLVRARIDSGQWEQQELSTTDGEGTDCIRSMVKIMEDETFGIWTSQKCSK